MASVIVTIVEVFTYAIIVGVIVSRIKKSRKEREQYSQAQRGPEFTPTQMDYTKDPDNMPGDVTVTVAGKPYKITTDTKPSDIKSNDIKTTVSREAEAVSADDAGAANTSQTSTTDYLAEKARLDQIDHARERREEIKRLSKKTGGLLPAERLYDGDSVPAGKHCVICGYCAAENLVPNGSERKYSCYFCREPL